MLPILAYRSSSSGIATFTYELSKALASVGYNILLPAWGLSKNAATTLKEKGVDVINLGDDIPELGYIGGPIFEYFLLSNSLKRLLKRKGATEAKAIFTIPGFALSFNNVFASKGWAFEGLLHAMQTGLRYLPIMLRVPGAIASVEYWLMDNKIFRKTKYILCITSSSSYKFNLTKYGSKVVYLTPPIELRHKPQEPSRKLRLLFVSRDLAIPRKGLVTLLKALVNVDVRLLQNIKLTLVGRNWEYFRVYIDYLRQKGLEVRATGFIDRSLMTEIYRDSDVLVYPSYHEEFGYAILEAMAHGLAIVASDIPSFRDMVVNGRNGFLIKPGDFSAIGRSISRLIEDRELLYQMKTESLKIVENKFNPKLTARTLEKLLNE